MKCPCCSGLSYEDCCQPYHKKEKLPNTSDVLMRSRYSAFAIPNADYLLETTLPSKRKYHSKVDLHEWGETNHWTKLEIIATPSPHQVEFKAYFTDQDGVSQIHHEFSRFRKLENLWYYVEGYFSNT